MEIFGIPVVITVRDIFSLGGSIVVLAIWLFLVAILFVLKLLEIYIKWRNRTD